MKQNELDKLLNAELRQQARAHKWKFSRGFVFKSTAKLFFTLLICGNAKGRNLHYRFMFKLLDFDDLFWKIVLLEENAARPLSFRVAGAWTAPMTTILTGNQSVSDWEAPTIEANVEAMIRRCEKLGNEISARIHNLDDNLNEIIKFNKAQREAFPDGLFDIYVERLLTSILKNDLAAAELIIRDRKANNDFGGFMVGGKTFYDLADEYLSKMR